MFTGNFHVRYIFLDLRNKKEDPLPFQLPSIYSLSRYLSVTHCPPSTLLDAEDSTGTKTDNTMQSSQNLNSNKKEKIK